MSTHPEIANILSKTAPLRQELLTHPLYDHLGTLENMQRFMELHVYAVWDFMSLLKSLQQKICCVSVPWIPTRYESCRRFINEIVLEEESDQNEQGGYSSHFELYLRSMNECGASTDTISRLIEHLQLGGELNEALRAARVPEAASQFVQTTFEIIETQDLCAIASAFTFGREGLIPDLFPHIVNQLQDLTAQFSIFKYYLERHIFLDGGQHGPLADRLLVTLCEDDPLRWQAVELTAIKALTVRKHLWDGMLAAIVSQHEVTASSAS